ncbi:LapA family protein [Simiduia agarivorans]|uniref:Lipopolysaccharide assembly protein A domain-containing protein n=1 Tax=Simiduia agarivorans (strain DSM 21679 / JCM 13881 / BCRC 17597 / SA1) TaxID=1117647 RepID=K4KIE7_SIMAS|nr:LapA family protein [Simiduia agarivorans]AFU97733.1 hypothetical protein M5M_02570 [Simiduia agarivorans SA1 = DSM 21679]
MSAIKRIIVLFLLLLFGILGAWFGWVNRTQVELNLLGVTSVELSLGIIVLGALSFGVFAGLAVAQISVYQLRLKNRSLTKKLSYNQGKAD